MTQYDYEDVWDGLVKDNEASLSSVDSTFFSRYLAEGREAEHDGDGQAVPQSPICIIDFSQGLPPVTPNVPDDYLGTPSPSPTVTRPLSMVPAPRGQETGPRDAAQEISTSGPSENPMFKADPTVTTQQPQLSVCHREESQPTEYPASGVETTPPSTTQAMVVTSVPIPMASFQNTSTLAENVICSLPQQQTQYLLVPQQAQLQSSSHTAVVGMVDIPVLNDSEGEYGFTVTVEEKERTTKSPMWLMSRITNKLYTNLNKAVPFEIHLKKPIDSDQFYIRAVPVFSSPQFLRTNVTRCPNHAAPADSTNHDFPYPEHVVRADHPGAHYVKNASGRLSVVVPLDTLQDGSDYTPVLLRFMCLGSCVGGINRRPIAVIITLENNLGHVYGRKVIDVRVCACPTRDIKTDEYAVLNKGTKRKGPVIQEKTPLVSRKKPRPIEPKVEPQEEDDKQFYIPVRGRQLYNFMMEMKAVYYRNHPDYAARYPDDNIIPSNSLTRHTDADEMKERFGRRSSIDEMEVSAWDSEVESPLRLNYDDNPSDEIDVVSTKNPLSQLQSHISVPSTVKVKVMEKKRTGGEDISSMTVENSDIKTWSQPSEIAVSSSRVSPVTIVSSLASVSPGLYSQSASKVDIINLPNVSLPKHVPVVQVSSYKHRESTLRRSTSDFKFRSHRQFFRNSSGNQKQITRESAKLSSVKVELDTSVYREEQSSPGSPEMLAANVLVEGFAKKKL